MANQTQDIVEELRERAEVFHKSYEDLKAFMKERGTFPVNLKPKDLWTPAADEIELLRARLERIEGNMKFFQPWQQDKLK
jgi:hypothetical protein